MGYSFRSINSLRTIGTFSTILIWERRKGRRRGTDAARHCAHVLALHRAHGSVEVDANPSARGDVRRRLDDDDAPAICRGVRHETVELDGRADGERVRGRDGRRHGLLPKDLRRVAPRGRFVAHSDPGV
jgi:ribosomal protein L30/L7E